MSHHQCGRCTPANSEVALRAAEREFRLLSPEYMTLARFFMQVRGWRLTDAVRLAKQRERTVDRLYREESEERIQRQWNNDSSLQLVTRRINEATARVRQMNAPAPDPAPAPAQAQTQPQAQSQTEAPTQSRETQPATSPSATQIENLADVQQQTATLTLAQQAELFEDNIAPEHLPETTQQRQERLDMELARQLAADLDSLEYGNMDWE